MEQPQVGFDLSNTTKVEGFDGNVLFAQGVILRKVSKFLLGGEATEDAILPIPVFYDLETRKVLVDTLPKELREEYKDYTFGN